MKNRELKQKLTNLLKDASDFKRRQQKKTRVLEKNDPNVILEK
jgi:hypothetical protein